MGKRLPGSRFCSKCSMFPIKQIANHPAFTTWSSLTKCLTGCLILPSFCGQVYKHCFTNKTKHLQCLVITTSLLAFVFLLAHWLETICHFSVFNILALQSALQHKQSPLRLVDIHECVLPARKKPERTLAVFLFFTKSEKFKNVTFFYSRSLKIQ